MPTRTHAERRKRFETSSGIDLPVAFDPANTEPVDYEKDLNPPGEFPYTRGIYSNMYRGRLWTMRQYAGYATAEESNARYKYLLAQGTTGLSVAFDLPTQIGLDSDDALSAGEVGKVGVAIDSLEDMLRLFDGIPVDNVSTSMTINATAAILLSLYLAVARRQNVPFEKVKGTLQNDILKEYIARGTYIYPPAPSLRLVTDTFAFCAHEVPTGIRSQSVVTTFARQALPQFRKLLLRSPMASRMSKQRCKPDWMLMISRRAFHSFSTRTIICWKRLPSFAPRAGFGRASCASDSRRATPVHRCCAFTRRRPAHL